MLPPDLIDLKPEDLRVEAEFFESLTRQPQPPVVREPAPWPPPEIARRRRSHPRPSSRRLPLRRRRNRRSLHHPRWRRQSLTRDGRPGPQAGRAAALRCRRQLAPKPLWSGPRSRSSTRPSCLPGPRFAGFSEVILPASVVLSWSLFVLLGIALSFVAGLLMGHFLWKMH